MLILLASGRQAAGPAGTWFGAGSGVRWVRWGGRGGCDGQNFRYSRLRAHTFAIFVQIRGCGGQNFRHSKARAHTFAIFVQIRGCDGQNFRYSKPRAHTFANFVQIRGAVAKIFDVPSRGHFISILALSQSTKRVEEGAFSFFDSPLRQPLETTPLFYLRLSGIFESLLIAPTPIA